MSLDENELNLLDLPDVPLRKIIRDYVPLSDKMYALSKMPEFDKYLSEPCYWFESSRAFAEMARDLPTGWYVDRILPTDVYYLIADPENKTLEFYHFYSRDPVVALESWIRRTISANRVRISNVLRDFRLQNVPAKEINVYRHERAYFSIPATRDRVCWWDGGQIYPLENNECRELDLEMNPADRTVRLGGKSLAPLEYRPMRVAKDPSYYSSSRNVYQRFSRIAYASPSLFETFQTDRVVFKMENENEITMISELYGYSPPRTDTFSHSVLCKRLANFVN